VGLHGTVAVDGYALGCLGEAVGLRSVFGEGRGGVVEERHGSELIFGDGY
jgi:hypothetical protein